MIVYSSIIRSLILAFVSIIVLSNLSPYFLDSFLEESARYWRWSEVRENVPKKYKLLILGDSQWISGLDLQILSNTSNIKQEEILVIAKPSQQMEGIELELDDLWSKGIDSDLYWINISPTSTTKNDVFLSFIPLQLYFATGSYRLLYEFKYWKVFYKDTGSYLYQLTSYLLPILRYNSHINSVTKLLPQIESIDLSGKDLASRMGEQWIGYYKSRYARNKLLVEYLGKDGLWEWKNYNQDRSICIPSEKKKPLPPAMQVSFSKIRPESIESLLRIQDKINLRSQNLNIIHIPFTDEMQAIQTSFPILLEEMEKENEFNLHLVPGKLFRASDYSDYTHLNRCGSAKLSAYLGGSILLNTRKSGN
jgi:hypothetical protein